MREYALLTGFPHLPPLWSLGYMQSHRTLASREQVLAKPPNSGGGKLALRRDDLSRHRLHVRTDGTPATVSSRSIREIFPDPHAMMRQLHDDGMRVVVHVVDPPLHLHGHRRRHGPGGEPRTTRRIIGTGIGRSLAAGIDGWWPDVGDKLDPAARLARIRMYWDGPIRDHPDRRPFALHRNGYAGMQRYGWLWSGDIDSAWQTLAMQVPVGINCGLTGIPLLGDRYRRLHHHAGADRRAVRALVPVRRVLPAVPRHGRTWKLRLPWGWNTGEYGPEEYDGRRLVPGTLPDRERAAQSGGRADLQGLSRAALSAAALPLFGGARGARNRHAGDARAVAALPVRSRGGRVRRRLSVGPRHPGRAGDREGRDAAARSICRPATGTISGPASAVTGGREITRAVDLETLPLYVRAGAIIATGPVKQQHRRELRTSR